MLDVHIDLDLVSKASPIRILCDFQQRSDKKDAVHNVCSPLALGSVDVRYCKNK